MNLSEFQDAVWGLLDDLDRKIPSGLIDIHGWQSTVRFVQLTGILRQGQALPVVNGYADLRPTPDSVGIAGPILRVEDSNTGRGLRLESLNRMDVLYGRDWRTRTQGPLELYLPGLPNVPAAAATQATREGFGNLLVYPLQAAGEVTIYFNGTPRRLRSDADVSNIPEHLHLGIAFGAAHAILAARGGDGKAALAAYCKEQWDWYVQQAQAEVAIWTPTE